MSDRIYLSPPWQSGSEADAVAEGVQSNWIAPLGPAVDAFETELSARCGVTDALATVSGTAALHLALLAVGVQSGDVVIVPTFTFIGTVNPVVYVGAEPWFVDSSEDTWNLDPGLLREALECCPIRGPQGGCCGRR